MIVVSSSVLLIEYLLLLIVEYYYRIMEVLEPSLEKQLKGHKNAITALHYSPNEEQIATGSLDNSVLLWDLRGSMRSYRFRGHNEAVMDVAFSPTGKHMASASRDKTVRLWVPTVTGSTGMFKAHSQTVRSVQFSPDGSKILTASDDKIVKLWSSEKYKFISSFVGHTNWVRCARVSCDGSIFASCSDDKTTRLWSPDSGECVHVFKDKNGYGVHLAWHPSGCYVAVGTTQGNVKLYDIRTHNLVQYYSIHNESITQLAFHPSGSYILTGSKDGKMKILDLLEGHPIFTLNGHTGAVSAVGFSPSGDTFCSTGDDKLVFFWKTNFTALQTDINENQHQNTQAIPKSASQVSKLSSAKARHMWSQCYHSIRYPISTFVHLDDVYDATTNDLSSHVTGFEGRPNANSTFISQGHEFDLQQGRTSSSRSMLYGHKDVNEDPSYSVGHISHIPRKPPTPTTYSLPTFNKSVGVGDTSVLVLDKTVNDNGLFGMISLNENDVCYTSGKIEWVGKKRSFPINSGFKIINNNESRNKEPSMKRRKNSEGYSGETMSRIRECECTDMLPTVNAIVDHLNALHEAVDLVDLRLNTLEEVMSGNES